MAGNAGPAWHCTYACVNHRRKRAVTAKIGTAIQNGDMSAGLRNHTIIDRICAGHGGGSSPFRRPCASSSHPKRRGILEEHRSCGFFSFPIIRHLQF